VSPGRLVLLVALAAAVLPVGLGLGLYCGLRHRPPDELPKPAPQQAPALEQVIAQAQAALEQERPRLQQACAQSPAPRALRLSLAFDAQGRQVGLGMVEDRHRPNSEETRCLQEALGLDLRIPPPGRTVSLELPFAFP
jgi:hypothetical protein